MAEYCKNCKDMADEIERLRQQAGFTPAFIKSILADQLADAKAEIWRLKQQLHLAEVLLSRKMSRDLEWQKDVIAYREDGV